VWAVTAVFGILLVGVGVVAIVDPIGSQMADDSDPFGQPPSRWRAAVLVLGGVVLLVWPVAVLLRRDGGSGAA
jgi:hypothetical protein